MSGRQRVVKRPTYEDDYQRPPPGEGSLESRARGMLAGVAVGDALGMPTEFLTLEQITAWYGRVEGLISPHLKHIHRRLQAGSVTDDTDQTLILARLLIERGFIEPREFLSRLVEWSETDRVRRNHFVGPSTRRALEAFKQGVSLERLPRSGTTVGAAMRVAPLAIAFAEREVLVEQVVASCSISHFTHNAISGAMAMAFALSEALLPDADPVSVARAAQEGAVVGRRFGDWSWAPPIERRIERVLGWAQDLAPEETLTRLYELVGVDLYPEQLVPCAIALAVISEANPMRAMLMAINVGGDTDTLASMSGSICGGLSGVSAFDVDMLARVEKLNSLNLLTTSEDLIRVRRSLPLLGGGESPARGFPNPPQPAARRS